MTKFSSFLLQSGSALAVALLAAAPAAAQETPTACQEGGEVSPDAEGAFACGLGAYAGADIGPGSDPDVIQATALGSHSVAVVDDSTATGYRAIASGKSSTANGSRAIAGGTFYNDLTTAIGAFAQAGLGEGQGGATAVGAGARANALNALAVGFNSRALGENAIALGANSRADESFTISVGNNFDKRRIVNVAAGSAASTPST